MLETDPCPKHPNGKHSWGACALNPKNEGNPELDKFRLKGKGKGKGQSKPRPKPAEVTAHSAELVPIPPQENQPAPMEGVQVETMDS